MLEALVEQSNIPNADRAIDQKAQLRRDPKTQAQRNLLLRLVVGGTTVAVSVAAYFSYQVVRNLMLENLKQNAFLSVQQGTNEIDSETSKENSHSAHEKRDTSVQIHEKNAGNFHIDSSKKTPLKERSHQSSNKILLQSY